VIALIVTTDGYPLGHEVFDGNTGDVTTVRQMVEKVEEDYGRCNRMWKTLAGWMKAGGLGDSPRELLEEMAAVKSGDVLLPTRNADGSAGVTLLIRCVTRPDEHTEVLLNRLGIRLPNHLKRQRLYATAPAKEACAT